MTKDNYLQLVEYLNKDNIDYIIIGLHKGKESNNCDVNIRIPNKKSALIMLEVLDNVATHLIEFIETPQTKRKGRRKKK